MIVCKFAGSIRAFITVFLKSFISQALERHRSGIDDSIIQPAELLTRLNADLIRDNLGKHVSIFYGVLDRETNDLEYANAGFYPFPFVWEESGYNSMDAKAFPIGLFDFASYETSHKKLSERFSFTLFSDGILEVLPQESIFDKIAYIKTFGDKSGFEIDRLISSLELDISEPLPDDIACLTIARGTFDA